MRQDAYLAERRDKRAKEGVVPVGARLAFAEKVRDLVDHRGNEVRSELATDDAVKEFVWAIREGVRQRDRTAIIQYAKIMKLVDAEMRVIHEFISEMGASSREELKSGFQTAKQAEGVDILTSIERCVAFLEGALPMHEAHRAVVVRRLGGYLPVDSDRLGTDSEPVAGA
jgi:histidinol dehydrogenase